MNDGLQHMYGIALADQEIQHLKIYIMSSTYGIAND